MKSALQKPLDISLKVLTALLLTAALALTFTVSDYYIFNRIGVFNPLFVICQWVKKAGLLLLPLAVYCRKRSCSDMAKYVLPVFVILSCFIFGKFFDVTMMTAESTGAQKVYAHINEFVPKILNKVLYFSSCGLYLAVCALLFVRDGFKIRAKSFAYLPFAILAVTPLNIFENFFNINNIAQNSFLRFKNFSLWHFIMIAALAGFTIGGYFILKPKSAQSRQDFLVAAAIVMLIQYHSKDSVLLGDGYNVYHTIFAAIPLFICNIGMYMVALSIFTRKRLLYSIAFFVHSAGALTVFFYFGRNDMSNYGIFCSYSILYFSLTHLLLFALSVMPSALGQYKFRAKDCVIPLAYYCAVIIAAAVASGAVTTLSSHFSYDGYTLVESEWLTPNYAFTQVNPLPIKVYNIPIKIFRCEFNLLYLVILYAAYVGIFWTFNGCYRAFLAIRRKVLAKGIAPLAYETVPALSPDLLTATGEIAAADETSAETVIDTTAPINETAPSEVLPPPDADNITE